MNNKDLKKFIQEEVKSLLEYEYYVDDQGWAHDDEGNKWFVGQGGGRGTFGLRNMPKGHRPTTLRRPRIAYPSGTTNELIQAFHSALEKTKSEKTKSFLDSVLRQYIQRGKLSDKQKEVVKRIFNQVELVDDQIKWVEIQG